MSHKEKLDETVSLYNKAEEMFKMTSHFIGRLNGQVGKEFHYISRAVVDVIASENTDLDKICHANHAIRVVINDCVDAVIDNAKTKAHQLHLDYPQLSTSDFYNSYQIGSFNDFKTALIEIDSIIEETRGNREKRDDKYYENIYKGESFKIVIGFLKKYPILENDMHNANLKLVKEAKLVLKASMLPYIGLGCTLIIVICTVLSVWMNFQTVWTHHPK
jgi:hypothetical protein